MKHPAKSKLSKKDNLLEIWIFCSRKISYTRYTCFLFSLLIMLVDQLLQVCERNLKATQNKTKKKKLTFFGWFTVIVYILHPQRLLHEIHMTPQYLCKHVIHKKHKLWVPFVFHSFLSLFLLKKPFKTILHCGPDILEPTKNNGSHDVWVKLRIGSHN